MRFAGGLSEMMPDRKRGCIKILVHPLFRIIFKNKASTFTSRGFVISQKFSICGINELHGKVHFRDYNPKQIILFPQRLDKDIAENDPVRIVDTIVGTT